MLRKNTRVNRTVTNNVAPERIIAQALNGMRCCSWQISDPGTAPTQRSASSKNMSCYLMLYFSVEGPKRLSNRVIVGNGLLSLPGQGFGDRLDYLGSPATIPEGLVQ